MELKIIKESEINDALDAEIRRDLCLAFPNDLENYQVTRAWHGSGPAWSVILEKGKTVVAHLGVVDRFVFVGEDLWHTAGIQNVYVLPEHRKQGLSDLIMKEAMGEAAKRNYDWGLLFCLCEITSVYARCGWTLMPAEVEIVRTDEAAGECPLPPNNTAMYYPLARRDFSPAKIHLRGNDW
jgi:GNAT superfamily N-acetyltransferase